jgi:hypothetical protein
MEQALMILLFLAPGLIVRMIRNFFNPDTPKNKIVVYEYLAGIVFDSVAVSMSISLVFEDIFSQYTTLTLEQLNRLFPFLLIMVFTSIAYYFIKYFLIVPLLIIIKDKTVGEKAGYKTELISVWKSVRHDKKKKGSWETVSIYRYSEHIATGMVDEFGLIDNDWDTFLLSHQRALSDLKDRYPDAFDIDVEYYNASTGLRVVWYDQKRIEEYWVDLYGKLPSEK